MWYVYLLFAIYCLIVWLFNTQSMTHTTFFNMTWDVLMMWHIQCFSCSNVLFNWVNNILHKWNISIKNCQLFLVNCHFTLQIRYNTGYPTYYVLNFAIIKSKSCDELFHLGWYMLDVPIMWLYLLLLYSIATNNELLDVIKQLENSHCVFSS